MSTLIMAKCWPLQMSTVQKAVLISLADNANDAGVCWPSIDTICQRTCVGRRAVISAIQALEEMGHLSAQRANGVVTNYRVTPCSRCTGAADAPVHLASRTRAADAPDPCSRCTGPVQQMHPNRKEPQRTVKSNRKDAQLPSWIPPDLWERWREHKRKIKSTMSEYSEGLAIAKLTKLRDAGQDPALVIETAILNGWKGLWALGGNGHADSTRGRRESDAERIERINREHDERERAEFRSVISKNE